MNPALKLLLKQVEDNSYMIEQVVKQSEQLDNFKLRAEVTDAFDHFHSGLSLVKIVLKGLL